MLIAITREVSESITRCELKHVVRRPIDLKLARAQHQAYQDHLTEFGCEVHTLPQEPNLPDSVFVEDTALVLDEVAIILRPGADSRKAETGSIAKVLSAFRKVCYITEPGTVDGGDILRVGKTLFVGMSERSNKAGAGQLRNIVQPLGYEVICVEVIGCLHLKSAVTQVAENTLLINRNWIRPDIFGKMSIIDIDPSEPYAANALYVNGTVMYPFSFPKTQKILEGAGIRLAIVDASELAKAEGALTCCSLIFKA